MLGFGWQDVIMVYSVIKELSKGDLKSMMWSVAWRRVKVGVE